MRIKIYPYKMGSEGAKRLAHALGVKRIKARGRYRPGPYTKIINWGSSSMPYGSNVLNSAGAVRIAANKLSTLTTLKRSGISTVEFTTDKHVAAEWQEEGFRVVVRHKLQGKSGDGIEICQPEDSLPYAPLYTKYTKKTNEYRVHVFKGKIIDWSEKVKRNGIEPTNALIRTHNHGWVFCRQGRVLPELVKEPSIKSVSALGLDFGAVDIIVKDNRAYVLECNTAPGIIESSVTAYANAIRSL